MSSSPQSNLQQNRKGFTVQPLNDVEEYTLERQRTSTINAAIAAGNTNLISPIPVRSPNVALRHLNDMQWTNPSTRSPATARDEIASILRRSSAAAAAVGSTSNINAGGATVSAGSSPPPAPTATTAANGNNGNTIHHNYFTDPHHRLLSICSTASLDEMPASPLHPFSPTTTATTNNNNNNNNMFHRRTYSPPPRNSNPMPHDVNFSYDVGASHEVAELDLFRVSPMMMV
eukprot:PhM_4_TR17422/c3_g1_i1/m.78030